MKKQLKVIIITLAVLFFGPLFIAVVISLFSSPEQTPKNVPSPVTPTSVPLYSLTNSFTDIPSPFPTIDPNNPPYSPQNLYVLKTQPSDGETQIPLNRELIVTFNRSFTADEVFFSISPSVTYSQTIQGNTLHITPLKPFLGSTLYTYTFSYSNQGTDRSYRFITQGNNPVYIPDTYSDPQGHADIWNRQHHPDAYLASKTPYGTLDFSVSSAVTSDTPAHFYFTVQLSQNSYNQAKQEFITWIKSTGLTDEQIQSLDIRYP